MFGVPLTQTQTIETKLKIALYIIPQVGASWLFFLRYERHLMIRGENNCAQHRSKAQHWTQTKGNNTQGALKRPRDNKGEEKVLLNETFGHFLSSSRSAHDSD